MLSLRLGSLGHILGEPPHPVIVPTRDNGDYARILLQSYYITGTGWGGSTQDILLEFRKLRVLGRLT